MERPSISTLSELKESGYRPRSVREELRINLLRKLRAGEPLFPGVHGYEDTVIPAIENALLDQLGDKLVNVSVTAWSRCLEGAVPHFTAQLNGLPVPSVC